MQLSLKWQQIVWWDVPQQKWSDTQQRWGLTKLLQHIYPFWQHPAVLLKLVQQESGLQAAEEWDPENEFQHILETLAEIKGSWDTSILYPHVVDASSDLLTCWAFMELLLYVLMCVVRLVVVVSLVLGQSVNARLHLFVSWIKGGHYIPRNTKV